MSLDIIEIAFAGALENIPEEAKEAIRKAKQFLPMIDIYHDSIKLDKNKGEISVVYMGKIENGKIIVYQCILAAQENKLNISRTLNKWDISQKLEELTNEI
jgi:hypothetical protein